MARIKKVGKLIFLTALPLMAAALVSGAAAYAPETLVPMGCAVGIELKTRGMVVAGLAETGGGLCPAAEAGILPGDVLVKLNGEDTPDADSFLTAAGEFDGGRVSVTVRRGEKLMQYSVAPAQDADGAWRLGVFLRDGVSGIGTVTFYDPETGLYGSLGHGVSEGEDGALVPLGEGLIRPATVVDVRRGEPGRPGELCGCMEPSERGSVLKNTGCGVFGLSPGFGGTGEALPVAARDEIEPGAATILSTVSGADVREYAVEIVKCAPGGDGREIMLRVTDEALLAATGGIVQGMSGSPIIQNGRLIGAVTHVLVSDPTRGYGLSLETMLQEAECGQKAA